MPSISVGADRNLLVGILALQLDFVTRDQLIEAMHRWVLQKHTPLEQLLSLTDEDRGALEVMARRHLAKHGHDVGRSLQALPIDAPMRSRLKLVADSDVVVSLASVPATPESWPATRPPEPGVAYPRPRFRPMHEHARGGLGVVMLAVDEELHRDVALKEIQGDKADHPAYRARFLMEGEITGKLEHPGVVPVYGMGTYADGRPYYAMRFIQGESLHDAIRRFHAADAEPQRDPGERSLALRGLLNRFVAVSNTVAHAHAKGVLHRDLKPANVMLGDYGETIVVDWGLAKTLGREGNGDTPATGWIQLSESTVTDATRQGQVFGTPQYMSPEQARGEHDRLGFASDVWALGAVLYAVLTGKPPYVGETTLAQAQRGDVVSLRHHNRTVPLALEAVCLKAMAKEPKGRYASAKELAADVERLLADEPVQAYREPLSARVRRWGRRHRTLVASTMVLLAACVVGLGLGLWAVNREKSAKETALERAQYNLDLAKKAVDAFFKLGKEHTEIRKPQLRKIRQLILENVLPFYQDFQEQRPDDVGIQEGLAEQHSRVAYILDEIGRRQEAMTAYEQARKIYIRLIKDHPEVPLYQQERARTHNNMGALLHGLGKHEEARKEYEEARTLQATLVKDHPELHRYQQERARTHNNMGAMLRDLGKPEEAGKEYEEARTLQARLVKHHPGVPEYRQDLATTHYNLGLLLRDLGKPEEARKEYEEARTLKATLVKDHPELHQYQQDLAMTHNALGNLLGNLGKPEEAGKEQEQARKIYIRLIKDHPEVPLYQQELARTHNNMGALLHGLGKHEEARKEYEEARTLQATLVKDHPDVPQYKAELGGTYLNLSLLQRQMAKPHDAIKSIERAIPLLQAARQREPRHPVYRHFLRYAHSTRADVLGDLNRHRDAVADWDEVLRLESNPGVRAGFRLQRADALARTGDYRRAMAEPDDLSRGTALPGDTLYSLSCIVALSAATSARDGSRPLPEREKQAQEWARQAVALLQRAAAAGYFRASATVAHLDQDRDLDALRSRDDYRAFRLALGVLKMPTPVPKP